jgi:hypothetical protein
MNEGTAENTATKPQLTRGQLETVADCLEALGIQPVHWGDTVFGRLVGMSIWLLTVASGLALIIVAWKGR